MKTNEILPQLDLVVLQEKANEFAMKGAIESIEEFYSGYNSPYRKAIQDNLENKGIDSSIAIPDIIGILNAGISTEIDLIANTAVSKTFIPLVKKFLTRADAEMKLSDIMKEFIECTNFTHGEDDMDDYRIEEIKEDGSFRYIQITNGTSTYEIHLYRKSKDGETPKVYEIYTLPNTVSKKTSSYSSISTNTMKISLDGVSLEMPFTKDVLSDPFVSFIATLVIANTKIAFDTTDFDEEMFPERNCHCD